MYLEQTVIKVVEVQVYFYLPLTVRFSYCTKLITDQSSFLNIYSTELQQTDGYESVSLCVIVLLVVVWNQVDTARSNRFV